MITVTAMLFLPSLPKKATLLDLDEEYGDLLRPIAPFVHGVMRGPSPLSRGERELIGAYVSALNRCRICFESHVLVAREFGIDESMLRSLIDDVTPHPSMRA
jgi:AhpD family alkylhydroperoxidase